jgi:hypothetical protein
MEKIRIVKGECLAKALVWLGFDYEKDQYGNYLFKRDADFDYAFKSLHYLRSLKKD